ncbi:MAG: hypothetical protein M0019_10610 [Actinomycetota bacterium]|nr:hypothetical protein [Actinomycetota bacterium]
MPITRLIDRDVVSHRVTSVNEPLLPYLAVPSDIVDEEAMLPF